MISLLTNSVQQIYKCLFCFSKDDFFFDKIGNLGVSGLEMLDLNVHALSFYINSHVDRIKKFKTQISGGLIFWISIFPVYNKLL